jgi:hypothetical protein
VGGAPVAVPQKVSLTFTPARQGPISWFVKVTEATPIYVCPKIEIS